MHRLVIRTLFAASLATLSITALAQDQVINRGQAQGPDQRRDGQGQRPGGFAGIGGDPNREAINTFRGMIKELDLSKQQQLQLKELARKYPAFLPEQEKKEGEAMMAKRRAFNDATESGTFNEAAARQLADEYAKLQADQMIEYAKMHAELLQLLTPEQKAKFNGKLAEAKKQREQRMEQFRQRRPDGPGLQTLPPGPPQL